MLSLYNSPKFSMLHASSGSLKKPAYMSSDLTWDLTVATVHVYINKFQLLRRNDCTPNLRSYVRFVNEAHCGYVFRGVSAPWAPLSRRCLWWRLSPAHGWCLPCCWEPWRWRALALWCWTVASVLTSTWMAVHGEDTNSHLTNCTEFAGCI